MCRAGLLERAEPETFWTSYLVCKTMSCDENSFKHNINKQAVLKWEWKQPLSCIKVRFLSPESMMENTVAFCLYFSWNFIGYVKLTLKSDWLFCFTVPFSLGEEKMVRFVNSPLWKRVIAWERSRAASGYGIIWGDADQNIQEELSAECHSVDWF